ncbi:unnamed protein product [Caenorhabditis nigoni]
MANAPAEPTFFYTLESDDHKLIKMSNLAVEQAVTLKNLVTGLGIDAEKAAKSPIPINNVDGATLEKVAAWCEHHRGEEPILEDVEEVYPRQTNIPEWDMEFLKALEGEDLEKLVLAAYELDAKKLLRYCCKKIAMMAEGKSPEELRIIFQIPYDEEDEMDEMELKERLERDAEEEEDERLGAPSTSNAL